jgi:hypothetical protein
MGSGAASVRSMIGKLRWPSEPRPPRSARGRRRPVRDGAVGLNTPTKRTADPPFPPLSNSMPIGHQSKLGQIRRWEGCPVC